MLDRQILPRHALAILIRADGQREDVTSDATFASSDPAVVTITPNGTLTPQAPGSAQITAHYGAFVGLTPITVVPLPADIERFYLAVNTPLWLGLTYPVTAYTLVGGRNVNVTNETTFSSSDPTVASITADGQLAPLRLGRTLVTGVYRNLTAVGDVTFIPAAGDQYPDEVSGTLVLAREGGTRPLPLIAGRVEISGGDQNGRFTSESVFFFRGIQHPGFDLVVSRSGIRTLRVPVPQVPASFRPLVLEPLPSMLHTSLEGNFCDSNPVSVTFRSINPGFFLVTDISASYPYDFNINVTATIDDATVPYYGNQSDVPLAPFEDHRIQLTASSLVQKYCGSDGSFSDYGRFSVSYLRPR